MTEHKKCGCEILHGLTSDKIAYCPTHLLAFEMAEALKGVTELLAIICEVICLDNPPPTGNENLAKARAVLSKLAEKGKPNETT